MLMPCEGQPNNRILLNKLVILRAKENDKLSRTLNLCLHRLDEAPRYKTGRAYKLRCERVTGTEMTQAADSVLEIGHRCIIVWCFTAL